MEYRAEIEGPNTLDNLLARGIPLTSIWTDATLQYTCRKLSKAAIALLPLPDATESGRLLARCTAKKVLACYERERKLIEMYPKYLSMRQWALSRELLSRYWVHMAQFPAAPPLPTEIWSTIFRHCVEGMSHVEQASVRTTLLLVCRRWNNVAGGDAVLWRNAHFDTPFTVWRRFGWLLNAKHAQLRIFVTDVQVKDWRSGERPFTIEEMASLIDRILLKIEQISELTITTSSPRHAYLVCGRLHTAAKAGFLDRHAVYLHTAMHSTVNHSSLPFASTTTFHLIRPGLFDTFGISAAKTVVV